MVAGRATTMVPSLACSSGVGTTPGSATWSLDRNDSTCGRRARLALADGTHPEIGDKFGHWYKITPVLGFVTFLKRTFRKGEKLDYSYFLNEEIMYVTSCSS